MAALKKDNIEKSGPEYLEKQKRVEKEMEKYVKSYGQVLLDFDFFNRILLKKEDKEAYKNVGKTLKTFYEYISTSTPFLYYESKEELIKRYKAFTKKEFTNYQEMFKEIKEKALKSTEENKKILCEKLKTDFPDTNRENYNYMIHSIDFPNLLKLAYLSEKYYASDSEMLLTICPEITSLNDRIRQEKEDSYYYRRRIRYNNYYDDYNNYNSYNNNRNGFYSDNDDDDYSSSSSSSSSSSRSYKALSSRRSSGGSSSGSSGSHHRPSGCRSKH